MKGPFDRHGNSDALTVDDTASLVVRGPDAGDLMREAEGRCTSPQDGQSLQEPTGRNPSRRRPGRAGRWVRRVAAASTPLLVNVAVAGPAFAWPECAC